MNITDAMVTRGALVARSWGVVSKHGEWTNEETQQQCARDIIEAVAPLIAATVWDEGFEAGATWEQSSPSGIPHDPPLNPYDRVKP